MGADGEAQGALREQRRAEASSGVSHQSGRLSANRVTDLVNVNRLCRNESCSCGQTVLRMKGAARPRDITTEGRGAGQEAYTLHSMQHVVLNLTWLERYDEVALLWCCRNDL